MSPLLSMSDAWPVPASTTPMCDHRRDRHLTRTISGPRRVAGMPLTYPIAEQTLDNGLRVVVSSDRAVPIVAVNLWYDVGSRHEPPGLTGFAHLFEHLMFQGSRNVAVRSALQPAGERRRQPEREHLLRPDQLLRVTAQRRPGPRALARGGPDGLPARRGQPGEPRQPARRGQGGEAAELRQPPVRRLVRATGQARLPRGPPVRAHDDRLDGRPRRGRRWRTCTRSSASTTARTTPY